MVITQDVNSIRILTMNHSSQHNPFSKELEESVKYALNHADGDDSIKAVVVYGGRDRSFSSGGDFNEIKNLSAGCDVEDWIDRVIDLYQCVLKIKKPTVAAVEGYAIGMGFQFAMMFDQRVMSEQAIFSMPELKHGIGCSVGAAILDHTHGHTVMKKILFECERLTAEQCYAYKIVDSVVTKDNLLPIAIAKATLLANYPVTAFSNTKEYINRKFISILDDVKEESKSIHKKTFAKRDVQAHIKNVLGKKY
ncbi:enoyl-CoA hydratase/isomerase family protein [Citrobacter sp. JGM124]|nr:enoyl-CoA hydratase/isomerase family protein [Citrobacter sp. JGM124]